jgi:hypothetical protein
MVGNRYDQGNGTGIRLDVYHGCLGLVYKKDRVYYAGMEYKSRQWLEALDMAVNQQFRDGVRAYNLFLISDNGSQPTSMSFMKARRVSTPGHGNYPGIQQLK